MLGECGWSDDDSEGEDCEGFHCVFPDASIAES